MAKKVYDYNSNQPIIEKDGTPSAVFRTWMLQLVSTITGSGGGGVDHNDLTGVTKDQHHNKLHEVIDETHHTYPIPKTGTEFLCDDATFKPVPNQTITLSGNVTGSGTSSFAATITNGAVTLAKMADIATDTFLGRVTAATGTVEVLTNAQAKTALDLSGANSGDQTITLTGDVTGSGTGSFAATIGALKVTNAMLAGSIDNTKLATNPLARANHTGTQSASTVSDFSSATAATSAVTANTAKITNATHTGDVTGSTALTIANAAVSLAKMDDVATASVFYRKTAGAGAPEVNTLATLKTDLGLTGTNSGDQTITDLYKLDGSRALTGDMDAGSNAISNVATVNGLEISLGAGAIASNVAVGYQTLYATTGGQNTANGYRALYSNTSGNQNTASGYWALYFNTTGNQNTASGYLTLWSNTSGIRNVASGYSAGRSTTSGSANQTGNNSIFLGSDTKANANGETNQIVIGDSATGNGSNTVTLGNDSITDTILKGDVATSGALTAGSGDPSEATSSECLCRVSAIELSVRETRLAPVTPP